MILVTGSNGVLGAAFKSFKNKKFHFLNTRKDVDLCSQEECKKFFDNKTLLGGFGSKAIANETTKEGRHVQLWKRGQPNKEGYYSLKNSESQKFITADTDSFELKGKSIPTCI